MNFEATLISLWNTIEQGQKKEFHMSYPFTAAQVETDSCREAIYSNAYYDLIIDYYGAALQVEADCVQHVDNTFDVAYCFRERVPELNLQDYPYQSIPKCYALMDLSALEDTGIVRLENPAGLDLGGQGILVGFLDTGIDYTHPAFRNSDGTTRVEAIWDQTVTDQEPPDGFAYGSLFTRDMINDALRRENPLEAVPTRDEEGHGTFLAGVACGSPDVSLDFSGAVPQSSIAMVKCKQAKQYLRDYYFVPDDVSCYQENDLMLGMAWLIRLAKAKQMPLVLCFGMGSSMGSHSGEEALSLLTDEMGRLRGNAIVVSAGNEANARHHYYQSGLLMGQTSDIEISVGDHVKGFYVEFWAGIPEIYHLSVISPTGERFVPGAGGVTGTYSWQFLFEKTRLTMDYTIAGDRMGGQLVYLRFEEPYPGIWTIGVTPVDVIEGAFHCWLPLSDFLKGEVFFLRSNPDTTILAPGMAKAAVTAGAYQSGSGAIYADSGRGFSASGQIKPDILAPGVNVFGPERGSRYGVRTGTSISAAVTAGGCAQIFQWGILENDLFSLNSTDLTNLLIRGADRMPDRIYPNPASGYGRLDVYQALATLRGR